jgi:hypothetical protein
MEAVDHGNLFCAFVLDAGTDYAAGSDPPGAGFSMAIGSLPG